MNKWYLSKSQQKDSAELESSVADLLRSKSHVLFLTAGGLSLICYYAALMIPAWTDILSTAFLITLVVVLTTALAVWALSRRPLIGHLIWLIGLAGAISLAVFLVLRVKP